MPYHLEKVKILVIDDMKPMLSLVKSVLNIYGIQTVFTAENGEDAFKIVCKEDPDLIITDWIMPIMDGLEFTKLVRNNPLSPNPYVPILMMTGFSSRLRVEAARDKGITEFLVKPFASRDLYTRIEQIIERPRQFVKVDAFFGPDRRRRINTDYSGPRRRDQDPERNPESDVYEVDASAEILKKLREKAKTV